MLPDAKQRGSRPGASRSVKGGRCEACQGDGVISIEMHFLPDVYVTWRSARAGATTARRSRSLPRQSIADARSHRRPALPRLENVPPIAHKAAHAPGRRAWVYIEVGQASTTLVRRRAQRVKLGARS